MMTFKQFLNEERRPERTKPAEIEDIIAFADKYAKHYLSGKHFLFRGGSGRGAPLMLGNSVSSSPRKSANTNNNYTLWMDNNPMFKDFPLRSQSFIATDQKHTAAGFGGVSILIVSDSAKIGRVGNDDLWFVEVDSHNHTTIEDFTTEQEFILRQLGIGNNQTYAELVESLKDATLEDIKEAAETTTIGRGQRELIKSVVDSMEHHNVESLFELWEKLFTPALFPTMTTGSEVSSEPALGEVWIQGSAAFISANKSRVHEEDRRELMEWASKKYPHFANFLESHWNDHDFEVSHGPDY